MRSQGKWPPRMSEAAKDPEKQRWAGRSLSPEEVERIRGQVTPPSEIPASKRADFARFVRRRRRRG